MTAPKVTLYWVCKTEDGWKRHKAAIGRNGKIRPKSAQVIFLRFFCDTCQKS